MESDENSYQPAGRREAFSFVHNDTFYVSHGLPDLSQYYSTGGRVSWIPDGPGGIPMQCFDSSTARWSTVQPTSQHPEDSKLWQSLSTLYAGVCCVVVDNSMYTFGGRRSGTAGVNEKGCADVHELNLVTMVWRKMPVLNPDEGPMCKEKGGMVDFKDELLCVFGGYGVGPLPRQPGATYHWDNAFDRFWSNELHVFDIHKHKWISPNISGLRPLPCAGFSFTRVDLHRAVLFGGRQRAARVNEAHILDMEKWHWSGVHVPLMPTVAWPKERSVHAACALVDPNTDRSSCSPCITPRPSLFVFSGAGSDGITINDAWILDVNSVSWKQVNPPVCIDKARMCHSMGMIYSGASEAVAVVFGGLSGKIERNASFTSFAPLQETIVLQFGVSSLYESCVSRILHHATHFSSQLHCLPAHIKMDLTKRRDRMNNLKHFISIRL